MISYQFNLVRRVFSFSNMKTLGATLETRFYPFEGVVRSHAREARECEGRETFKHDLAS